MFFQTHWRIGETVARIAQERMPSRIHSLAFCWGSVIPDLVHPYNSIPHTMDGSYLLMNKLLKQAQSAHVWNLRDYSIHLGVINHFICDYFCLAHNKPALTGFIPHVLYEARLGSKINGKRMRALALASLSAEEKGICDLHKFLSDKHQSYTKAAEGLETDVAYAIPVVLTVILKLLNQDHPRQLLHVA